MPGPSTVLLLLLRVSESRMYRSHVFCSPASHTPLGLPISLALSISIGASRACTPWRARQFAIVRAWSVPTETYFTRLSLAIWRRYVPQMTLAFIRVVKRLVSAVGRLCYVLLGAGHREARCRNGAKAHDAQGGFEDGSRAAGRAFPYLPSTSESTRRFRLQGLPSALGV